MATIPQIRTRLLEVFPEKQADVLAHVVIEAHDDLVTQADFHKLTGTVSDLAGRVSDLTGRVSDLTGTVSDLTGTVSDLTGTVSDLTGRVSDLTGTVSNLAGVVEGLAVAQKRTEFTVKDLAKQVGGLSNAFGGSLEDFACDLVPEILEKHWRLEVASAQPEEIETGLGHHEMDLVVRGTIDRRPVVVVCEVKATVTATEVGRFLKTIERLRAARPGEDIRPLFFGYRADRKAREAIAAAGAAMVFTRGVMIPAA